VTETVILSGLAKDLASKGEARSFVAFRMTVQMAMGCRAGSDVRFFFASIFGDGPLLLLELE
jgi:hypothetical protein